MSLAIPAIDGCDVGDRVDGGVLGSERDTWHKKASAFLPPGGPPSFLVDKPNMVMELLNGKWRSLLARSFAHRGNGCERMHLVTSITSGGTCVHERAYGIEGVN